MIVNGEVRSETRVEFQCNKKCQHKYVCKYYEKMVELVKDLQKVVDGYDDSLAAAVDFVDIRCKLYNSSSKANNEMPNICTDPELARTLK